MVSGLLGNRSFCTVTQMAFVKLDSIRNGELCLITQPQVDAIMYGLLPFDISQLKQIENQILDMPYPYGSIPKQ